MGWLIYFVVEGSGVNGFSGPEGVSGRALAHSLTAQVFNHQVSLSWETFILAPKTSSEDPTLPLEDPANPHFQAPRDSTANLGIGTRICHNNNL